MTIATSFEFSGCAILSFQAPDINEWQGMVINLGRQLCVLSSVRPRRTVAWFAALALAVSFTPAHAAKPAWDQTANIKEAANHLSKVHRAQGSQGVLKFLDACYRTHTLASDFNRGLEACMAQDYMHSKVLAEIYGRLPEDARANRNVPTPELIAKTMAGRFAAIFSQYKFTQAQSDGFKASVDKHGFPIFLKAVFPKEPAGGEDKK